MNTLIFRTVAPLITVTMVVFSFFVMLRGHNEPGGGFIGGLIAASSMSIYAMAAGAAAARHAIKADPLAYAGAGVALACLSGVLSLLYDVPFLTGIWMVFDLFGTEVALSTPLVFDIGVYLAVFGTITAIALGLDDGGEVA